jgi:hypothetical protein
MELKTLRGYIEINFINGFIRLFTLLARLLILFIRKFKENLRLYINYRDLNIITIKNRYPLPLISEFIDRLAIINKYT